MRVLRALLASAIALGAVNGEAQILPFGEFAARDGRPGEGKRWKLDDARGAALAAALNALAAKTPIVIDYDHQTLRAEANGQAAPAAGWMRGFEWRDATGLFATVEWTERAKAHIAAGEYRYISPVITFDKASGAVTGVLLAALVNHPALLGMEPVVAQLATQFTSSDLQENRMDLAKLIASLGLAAGASEADIQTHITALMARPTQAQLPAALSSALGLQANADEATALAAVTALRSGDASAMAAITALNTQVATLTAQINDRTVTELVDGAIQGLKLAPALRDWALDQGRKDLASLQALIAKSPPIPGLAGQSQGKDPGGDGAAALSAQAAEVIERMGLSKEQFDKAAVAA